MIDGLRPYPEMKSSGLPWVGDVPAHWDVLRSKRLLKATEIPVRPDDEIVTCFRDGQVTLRRNRRSSGFMIALLEQGYQGVRAGQLVVHSMDAFAGAIGVSDSDGKCTPEYIVCEPRSDSAVPGYYSWVLRQAARTGYILASCPAVRERAPRLRYPNLGELQVPVPSVDEQRLIVRFLDWHGAQTAKLVRAKKKIIALLNEQKQAIIHRAVTRGLDPNAKLKPSGIPWLGDVPEGWQIMPLKRITKSRCDGPFGSGLKSSHYSSSGIFVVRLQNIGMGEFIRKEGAYISREHYASLGDHSVFHNDIIIASLGDELRPCGRACVAPPGLGDAMVKADCFRFRLDTKRVSPAFMVAHLSATARDSAVMLSAGATRQRVNLEATAQRAVLLPSLDEQNRIHDWISSTTRIIDNTIAETQREIALIQEFRTRLIADVVTGKLDVRAAAASLPEVTEIEPIDDPAEGDDLDEAIEDTENEEAAA